MVKGVTKRVIMIKPPNGEVFEQAIFIVRDEVLQKGQISGTRILQEACRVADGYLKKKKRGWRPELYAILAAVAGATAMGGLWLLCTFVF